MSERTEIGNPVKRKVLLAGLLAALLALAFLFQGGRGIFETTEGRYGSVASEMIRLHDWVVPHLNEETVHFTKPPLTYWALGASLEVFGRNEWALRIPSAVAFVLTVLLIARAGYLLVPEHPLLPSLVYASFLFPATVSNVVSTDTLLTFSEVAAMLCFAEHYFGTQKWKLSPAVLGWAFFGLAFATKGYPALLPAMALAVFHRLRGRRWPGKTLSVATGSVVFAAIGLSWYALVIWRDPSLLQYFFANELYGRLTGVHDRNPEWYKAITIYGPVILFGTIPWTLQSARALRDAFRRLRRSGESDRGSTPGRRDVVLYLLLWLALPTVVYIFAKSRTELYILPQFAPLAILTALYVSEQQPRLRTIGSKVGAGVVLVLALRVAGSLVDSHNDNRPAAEAIAALWGGAPDEIVFVDATAYRGIAVYLGCEVEETGMSTGRRPVEPVLRKRGKADAGTVWLVPVPLADEFRSVASAEGAGNVTLLGEVETELPLLAFATGNRETLASSRSRAAPLTEHR